MPKLYRSTSRVNCLSRKVKVCDPGMRNTGQGHQQGLTAFASGTLHSGLPSIHPLWSGTNQCFSVGTGSETGRGNNGRALPVRSPFSCAEAKAQHYTWLLLYPIQRCMGCIPTLQNITSHSCEGLLPEEQALLSVMLEPNADTPGHTQTPLGTSQLCWGGCSTEGHFCANL